MFATLGAFVVFCIAVLHAYWGFGGKFLIDKAVPTTNNGIPLFIPGRVATFAVVAVLLVLAWAMVSSGVIANTVSAIFALIFLLDLSVISTTQECSKNTKIPNLPAWIR